MERASSVSLRPPRASRLRVLARGSASAADGACANAVGYPEATVQLARRVARNPFVPWKAWRREKYGYAAVPTAAVPPPSDALTTLRSIKAHRNPVQHIPRKPAKQGSRKGRKTLVRRAAERTPEAVYAAPCAGYSKVAASPENSAFSPPSIMSTLSLFSSRPSSPLSAAGADPVSPQFLRSFSQSTLSPRSRPTAASSCVSYSHQQKNKSVTEEQYALPTFHENSSHEALHIPCHLVRVGRASHHGNCSSSGPSQSELLGTRRRCWLVDEGQHSLCGRLREAGCGPLQHAEHSCPGPAAEVRCRSAFPPPCSCIEFCQAYAASLESRFENLEIRRLAVSASPDRTTRSKSAVDPLEPFTAVHQPAWKCASAFGSTVHAAAISAIPSTAAVADVVGAHETGEFTQFLAESAGSTSCALSSEVGDNDKLRSRDCFPREDSSRTHPFPGGFFITLHSFSRRERQFSEVCTSNRKVPTTDAEADNTVRSAVATLCGRHHQTGLTFASAAYSKGTSLRRNAVGSSQATASSAATSKAAVSPTRAASSTETLYSAAEPDATAAATAALPTHAASCDSQQRSSDVKATTAVAASGQTSADDRPLALLTSQISQPPFRRMAASASASRSLKKCCESLAAATGLGGTATLSPCSVWCGSECDFSSASGIPVKASGGSVRVTAAYAAMEQDTDGALLPVPTGEIVSEASSSAAVQRDQRRTALSSSCQPGTLWKSEEKPRSQQSYGGHWSNHVQLPSHIMQREPLLVRYTQFHSSQPEGRDTEGRSYKLCGTVTRRPHTESEGETDDSENGSSCRRAEGLRWSCVKLTKPITAHLQCTLSR